MTLEDEPVTVQELDRRIGDIEQHIRDQGALPPAAETVHAHVERTVHALLEEIERRTDRADGDGDAPTDIKFLAEAVQALSAWRPTRPLGIALETPRSACPCGFGTGQRSFHAPGCPRIQENDE